MYISRQLHSMQQQHVSTEARSAVAVDDDRVSAQHPQVVLSDTAKDCTRDADKSSRGRDQAQTHRHRGQQQPSASTSAAEVSR